MSRTEKPVIKVTEILDMLNDGKTRTQIQQHFGMEDYELKVLFQHPKLKGKKTKKKKEVHFVIEDDTVEQNTANIAEELAENDIINNAAENTDANNEEENPIAESTNNFYSDVDEVVETENEPQEEIVE